jgi:hypothetical protein
MQRVIAGGIELRIEDGYPIDRSTEFLRVPDRHRSVLTLWRKALHHVADAANIDRRFTAGFILDDGRMALTADGDGGAVVCINPDRYREAIRKYGSEPLSLAAFLHGVACHELAHLDGRMGRGHDEEFIAAREDLGASTAHTIPQIAELAACTLGLGPCNATPTKYEVARQEAVRACEPEVTGAEASCHEVDPLAPMVASFVDRLLVVRPGGLSRDYIEGFAVRHEARLRAAVAGLSHEHLARGSVSRRMTPEIQPSINESESAESLPSKAKPFASVDAALDALDVGDLRRDLEMVRPETSKSNAELIEAASDALMTADSVETLTDLTVNLLDAAESLSAVRGSPASRAADAVLKKINRVLARLPITSVRHVESLPAKKGHAAKVAHVIASIRAKLGPHVLRPDWRKRRPANATPSWGCCYVASEAAYHALGGAKSGLRVMHIAHEGAPHWYLTDGRGRVIDPTADQFSSPVPYEQGRGKGFLTTEPSKRAVALLADAGLSAG